MAGSSQAVDISKFSGAARATLSDSVAVEEPLEIRLGFSTPDGRASRSVSITMRTPGNDFELAAGFLFSESIVSRAADIASVDVCGGPAPDTGTHNVVRVELAPAFSRSPWMLPIDPFCMSESTGGWILCSKLALWTKLRNCASARS